MDAADVTGSRPLHMAAAKGHEELVTWLLKFGVESDVPDADGWTPLHFACIKPGEWPSERASERASARVRTRARAASQEPH